MKLTFFTIACLALATEARRQSHRLGDRNRNNGVSAEQTQKFVDYAGTMGKHYKGTLEFQQRLELFNAADEYINKVNSEADASDKPNPLRLKHTRFSDQTQLEKEQVLGTMEKDMDRVEGQIRRSAPGMKNKGSSGPLQTGCVDWTADQLVGPVKDQGGCGSCYAFASNTVLESVISIRSGNSQVTRLSEQQIVDCAHNDVYGEYGTWGCNGGWMDEVFRYQQANGAMTDADYPYFSGTTGTHGTCTFDAASNVVARVADYDLFSNDVHKMVGRLQDGPLVVGVYANDNWFYYDSGIMTIDDCPDTYINHAVALVGYTNTDEEEEEDDDNNDDESDDDGISQMTVYERVERTCRRQRWSDKQSEEGCTGSDETLIDGRYCCTEEVYNEYREPNMIRSSGGQAHWKIQNSWGEGWGADGFIYLEAGEGAGACSVNSYVLSVEPEL